MNCYRDNATPASYGFGDVPHITEPPQNPSNVAAARALLAGLDGDWRLAEALAELADACAALEEAKHVTTLAMGVLGGDIRISR